MHIYRVYIIKLVHCEETHIHLANQGTTAMVHYRYLNCFNTSGVVNGSRSTPFVVCKSFTFGKYDIRSSLNSSPVIFFSNSTSFKPVQQEAVCLYSSRWMLVLDIPSVFEDMKGGVSIPY